MKESKNIDQLFQQKLKNLEMNPSSQVWNNIEAKLKKKKRRILPMWWFYGGAAAILLVGILSYPLVSKKNTSNKNIIPIIVDTPESNLKKEIESKDSIFNLEKESIQVVTIEKKKKEYNIKKPQKISTNSIAKRKEKSPKIKGVNSTFKNIIEKNSIALLKQKNQNRKVKDSIPISVTKKDFIAEVFSNDTILIEKKKHNKWIVSPTIALLATNSFSSTSSLDKSLNSNPTEGANSFSYGVKVAYQINDKWSIQSGIHLQNLDFLNKNLTIVSSTTSNTLSNVDSSIENLFSINSSDVINNSSSLMNIITTKATVTQSYGYIEIPLEVQYSFFKSNKFDTKIVTGFSSLILQKNEIAISSSAINKVIGKANNLNNLNFSSNLGLDVDYSINKKLQLNFNPVFKIQLNTFSQNSNGFKPYTIGFYTGIKYQF